jgi:hypothetical protein
MANAIILRRDQSAATEVGELLQWIRDLRAVYERGVRIRAKMRHNFSDAGGENAIDWAALETLWGVPVNAANGETPSVGTGANGKAIYTYLDGAVGGMEGNFQTNAAKEITERVM